jgi:multiple sugar transport system permease protein
MKRDGNDIAGYLWISPWIVGFLAFLALPIGMSLYYSFTDYPLLEKPLWVGAENYLRLARDPVFWTVMRNTVIYAAVSIPLGTMVAILIAVLLNQPVRGTGFFRAAVFVPTLVPLVASAMVWLWLYNGELGLINQVLRPVFRLAGLEAPSWLSEKAWAMPALIFMSLWSIGQGVVVYLAALKDVPQALYEAADLDGVGPVRRFLNVTLPMISPVVLFNVIMSVIGAWQVFAIPYVMTRGDPDRATYFYSMYLYDNAFVFGPKMGYASALAWVQFVIILALTGLTIWASKKLVFYRAE